MKSDLSKIYTGMGDQGLTDLGNGQRVDKDHLRIEVYGTLDELNSFIGLLLTYPLTPIISQSLATIQHDLFSLGSELSGAAQSVIMARHVIDLENTIDELSEQLSPLQAFILPGGTQTVALCHVARTVCRRAERQWVTLNRLETVNPNSLVYLNRLSDLLFIMARYLLKIAGKTEIVWKKTCTVNEK
ncbi:MAG: ATP:cob(I)alamin adenosyltransferase [Beggiatoa sp. IS2]|nr:MAG: ATP:cob(I)alamin adenosyltransferase [Beggiatoa sp. IS2]